MYIKGKQIKNKSIELLKLDDSSGQNFLLKTNSMLGLTDGPTLGTDIANKDYVDTKDNDKEDKSNKKNNLNSPNNTTYPTTLAVSDAIGNLNNLQLGITSSTAYRGDRGKTAYDHSQLTSGNPHDVTKSDVGLGNVDNTSDINKPISTATQNALNDKQDELTAGSNISINSSNVISSTNTTYNNGTVSLLNTGTNTSNRVWSAKVLSDWANGKFALTSDPRFHTHSNKTVLDGISSGDVTDWDTAFDEKVNSISVSGTQNKVLTITREDGTTLTAPFSDINYPNLPDDVINTLTFDDTNGKLVAVTSEGQSISTNLDGRYSLLGHGHSISDISNLQSSLNSKQDELTAGSNISINGSNVISATDTTYNNGTVSLLNTGTNTSNRVWSAKNLSDWISGKGFLTSVDISGKEDKSNKKNNLNSPNNTTYPTTLAVSDAIGNLNNLQLGITSSTAYRGDRGKTAYDHSQLTSGNPHNVGKGDVGLGNVDNTSDINKPISTATQNALNDKQDELTAGSNISINGSNVISATDTNTTYPSGSVSLLNTGTNTTSRVWSAKNLSDWISGKGFLTSVDISGKADKVTTITGTGYLTGGGTLASNRTIDINSGTKTKIDNGSTAYGWGNHASEGYLILSDISGKEDKSNKKNNLNSPNNTTYPTTKAVSDAISGFSSLQLGITSSTAYRGDRGKTAYDHSQLTSGNPHDVTKSDVGLGNVDNTSDINKPISTATQNALNDKQDELTAGSNITINGSNVISATDTNTTYPSGSLSLLNTGTNTTSRVWSAKNLSDWANGKFALINDPRFHTHSNKSVLDGISSGDVTDWDTAFDEKVNSISVSGTQNKVLTITREDGTTLTANFSDINDPNLPDDVINTLTFDDTNGKLVAVTSEGQSISTNLDGRYSLLGHGHSISDISNLQSSLNSKQDELTAGSNISINSSNVISATDTTYNSGSLSLLNTGTNTSNRVWSAKNLSDWANGKFALKNHTHDISDINDLQTKLNSKEDKNNKKDNLNSPNNTKYPTTKAVTDYVGDGELTINVDNNQVLTFSANDKNDKVLDLYSSGSNFVNIEYSSLKSLYNSSDLDIGTIYYIVDRGIWTMALDTDKLSKNCQREFMIVKENLYTPIDNFVGIYGQTFKQGDVPMYNHYAIWGGRVWVRGSGYDGGTTSNEIITGGGWTMVNESDTKYYVNKVFTIEYNFEDDLIWSQTDDRGNTIKRIDENTSYIDITDWGNPDIYNNNNYGVFNNFMPSARAKIYNNSNKGNINFNSNDGEIYNNINTGDIRTNSNLGGIYDNINGGAIYNNSNTDDINSNSNSEYITYNNNEGRIFNNKNTGFIGYNENSGNIDRNTNTGAIDDNSNGGRIHNNSNSSFIRGNSNNGDINNNKNTGFIGYNENSGSIDSNSNTGHIKNNSNGGTIDRNFNAGAIDDNTNTGRINSNSNNSYIRNNSNSGDIDYNSCSGNISLNSNRHIIKNSNKGSIRVNGNIDILDNSNKGNIISNYNEGDILGNSNLGGIMNNSNNGYIELNRNGGVIEYNDNNPSYSQYRFFIYKNYNTEGIRYNRSVRNSSLYIGRNGNNGTIGSTSNTPIDRTTNLTPSVNNI